MNPGWQIPPAPANRTQTQTPLTVATLVSRATSLKHYLTVGAISPRLTRVGRE